MKRFVTYLYEYDRGVRGRNTGFVRTDIRETFCRMELHIRGLDRYKGKEPVYLVIADNSPTGVTVGEILISQGVGNILLTFPDQRISPSPYTIDKLQALIIPLGNGSLLAGSFVKEPAEGILSGHFSQWTPDATVRKDTVPTPVPPTNITHESDSFSEKSVSAELPVDNTSAAEIKVPENQVPVDSASATGNQTTGGSLPPLETKEQETPPQPEVSYRRIELTDIRSLPRRNWYLSNNRFVVHGFFNYHYLLLKTVKLPEGRKRYLGIPGIYEQPERMMALLFGFPEFELSDEARRSRSQSDTDMTGAFGYWMCPVSEE